MPVAEDKSEQIYAVLSLFYICIIDMVCVQKQYIVIISILVPLKRAFLLRLNLCPVNANVYVTENGKHLPNKMTVCMHTVIPPRMCVLSIVGPGKNWPAIKFYDDP